MPLASSARPCRSVGRPSSGVWSILKSPVCRIVPNGVSIATAMPSGIECVTRRNRIENGPAVGTFAGGDDVQVGPVGDPVLLELALQQLEREGRAVDRQMVELAEQVRQRADVVLVAVGEHDRFDAVDVLAHVVEVRQHQVDAGHVPRGERQADVDDEDASVDLDAGHVATDLPDTSEEDDATEVRVRGDRRPPAPCARARVLRRWPAPAAAAWDRPGGPASPARPSPGWGWR